MNSSKTFAEAFAHASGLLEENPHLFSFERIAILHSSGFAVIADLSSRASESETVLIVSLGIALDDFRANFARACDYRDARIISQLEGEE